MAPYISAKQAWLRLAVSLSLGVSVAALLCSLFRGPELGFLYDFLLRHRPALPVARELLIIDTIQEAPPGTDPAAPNTVDNVLEPSAAASLLLIITELGAEALILETPVLGLSAGSSVREEEVRYHFDREFGILTRNITNFFDAIRTGSIAPAESNIYLEELVELSLQGKERLVTTLVSRDEEGIRYLEQAARVFGNVRRPGDLLVQVLRSGEGDRPGALAEPGEYSRVVPDRDGILRRITPLRPSVGNAAEEHIVYRVLKPRFERTEILYTEAGPLLVLESFDGSVRNLSLDLNGALLFEIPRRGEDFRRLNLEVFLSYDEADQSLRLLLEESGTLGIFSLLEGEENPVFLYDYALSLKEDLLREPGEELKARWKDAREDYFAGLDAFLYGPSEMTLVRNVSAGLLAADFAPSGLDLDGPSLSPEAAQAQRKQLEAKRESLIQTFSLLRQKYQEVLDLRSALGSQLAGSFCILGPGSINTPESRGTLSVPPVKPLFPFISQYLPGFMKKASQTPGKTWSDTEASALLANSLLSGRSITPGAELWLFWGSLAVSLVCAFLLFPFRFFVGLALGAGLTFFSLLGFSLYFIFTGVWYDPLVPAASAGTVTLVSAVWALVLRRGFCRRFAVCYGSVVSPGGLRALIREGKPWPSEIITQNVAIIAVRNMELILAEDREQGEAAARAVTVFREKVSRSFKRAGAITAGNGGDLVLACFGSPLERIILGQKEASLSDFASRGAPAIRAAGFISELLKHEESKAWSFGLDTGLCSFTWTPGSGYSAFGRPVIRARFLSSLTERYHARIVASGPVSEFLPELPVRRLGVLRERDGSQGESFYELLL